MSGFCDECKWYSVEDDRSAPHCIPCTIGREDNWEPVMESREKEEKKAGKSCDTCDWKERYEADCADMTGCDVCPCNGCLCAGNTNYPNWSSTPEIPPARSCRTCGWEKVFRDACGEYCGDCTECPCLACDCGQVEGYPHWTPKEDKKDNNENKLVNGEEQFKELLDGSQDAPLFDNEAMATFLQELQRKEFEVWAYKNADYASRRHAGNPFANFDEVADDLSITPEKVLGIHLLKHLRTIKAYIQHGALESREDLLTCIIDARKFLAILGGMAKRKGDL